MSVPEVSPFVAGLIAIGIAMCCPLMFFGVLALRDWLLHLWGQRNAPIETPEPRVWTEGDRAWSDIHHADWMARRGLLDVQVLADAFLAPISAAADPHPPG